MEGDASPVGMVDAIAETLWAAVSAQDLVAACDDLRMPEAHAGISPWTSKRAYVRARLMEMATPELAGMARAAADRYDDPQLAALAG